MTDHDYTPTTHDDPTGSAAPPDPWNRINGEPRRITALEGRIARALAVSRTFAGDDFDCIDAIRAILKETDK
jgi:hypothetical protein